MGFGHGRSAICELITNTQPHITRHNNIITRQETHELILQGLGVLVSGRVAVTEVRWPRTIPPSVRPSTSLTHVGWIGPQRTHAHAVHLYRRETPLPSSSRTVKYAGPCNRPFGRAGGGALDAPQPHSYQPKHMRSTAVFSRSSPGLPSSTLIGVFVKQRPALLWYRLKQRKHSVYVCNQKADGDESLLIRLTTASSTAAKQEPDVQDAHLNGVAAAEPSLEVLRRAETSQPSSDHDAQPITNGLALFHGVRRENHAAACRKGGDHLPHGPAPRTRKGARST